MFVVQDKRVLESERTDFKRLIYCPDYLELGHNHNMSSVGYVLTFYFVDKCCIACFFTTSKPEEHKKRGVTQTTVHLIFLNTFPFRA